MSRFKAFAIHLLGSLFIVSVLLTIMLLFWYPAPYFEVNGGWTVLQILIGVDIVLGPILTLIVYKPNKPGLKFDMACIVALQVGALVYGGIVTYQERPVFVVFNVDRFSTVTAAAVDVTELKFPELKPSFGNGPQLVEAIFPSDPEERQELMFAVFGGGKDIHERPDLYQPYQPNIDWLQQKSIDIESIIKTSEVARQQLDQFLNQHSGTQDDYVFLPLTGKNKDIVMVVSANNGQPVGTVSISPWITNYLTPGEEQASR